MNSFSQIYMNSKVVATMLEQVPEDERENFLEQLRRSIEQYDHLAGLGWDKSSIAEALRGTVNQPQQGDRRPPRRR